MIAIHHPTLKARNPVHVPDLIESFIFMSVDGVLLMSDLVYGLPKTYYFF